MAGDDFSFTALGEGRFALRGTLGFSTAGAVLKCSERLFAGVSGPLEIDLSGVSQTDSAGLALLIEWLSRAARAPRTMKFLNVPEQLQAIARISELENLIVAPAG